MLIRLSMIFLVMLSSSFYSNLYAQLLFDPGAGDMVAEPKKQRIMSLCIINKAHYPISFSIEDIRKNSWSDIKMDPYGEKVFIYPVSQRNPLIFYYPDNENREQAMKIPLEPKVTTRQDCQSAHVYEFYGQHERYLYLRESRK